MKARFKKISLLIIYAAFSLLLLSLTAYSDDYGFIVAVSKYDDPNMSALDGAVTDARNIRQSWIEAGMDPDKIVIISGNDATMDGVFSRLEALTRRMKPTDTLRTAWGGHAAIDGGVSLKDVPLTNVDLEFLLMNLPVKNIELFFDTCFACQTIVGRIRGKNIAILGGTSPEELSRPFLLEEEGKAPEAKSVASYLYSRAYGKSSDSGQFSRADAIGNRDGRVSLEEVQNYMNSQPPVFDTWHNEPIEQTACVKKVYDIASDIKKLSHFTLMCTMKTMAQCRSLGSSVHGSTETAVTFNVDIQRRDLTPFHISENEQISYNARGGSVTYEIAQEYAHDTNTLTYRGSGTASIGEGFNFTLDIYPAAGIFIFGISTPPLEAVYKNFDGPIEVDSRNVPVMMGAGHGGYYNAETNDLNGAKMWTMNEYLTERSPTRMAEAAASKTANLQGSKNLEAALKASLEFILPPTITIDCAFLVAQSSYAGAEDVLVSGTVSTEWSFE